MGSEEIVRFVREHPYGVVATLGPAGEPQAALVGLAATDRGRSSSTPIPHPARH